MRKKLLLICLLACAVFSVVACSGKNNTEPPDGPGGIIQPEQKIVVTVNANGGKFAGDKTSVEVKADGDSKATLTEAPTRDEYTLTGYNTKADGSGTVVTFGADGTAFTKDTTVYAQWQKNEQPQPEIYTVTVNANGGKFAGDKTSVEVKADGDGKITVTETPTRDGYTLTGYNTKADGSGTVVTFGADGTAFTVDTTVYAQWEIVPEPVVVTVDANGGTFAENKTSLELTAGDDGKIADVDEPERDGYTFTGYNTKADGSGTEVTFGADGTAFTEDTTVYAQWQQDDPEVITVTVNANGGKFADNATSMVLDVDDDGKTQDVTQPARYGYIFDGYNTKADGSGSAVTFGESGTAFTASATVYAQWQVNKSALTEGYRMQFATPELNNRVEADDMYLKAERLGGDDGFLISMVGFGSFADSEYVRLIFHTSDIDSSGWALQSSDLTVLVSKTKATYRTGLTQFWTSDGGYSMYDPANESALSNMPEYVDHGGFFTLTIKVMDSEIPGYSAAMRVSLFAMEFNNGAIYDGKDYKNGMLVDGKSQGDPAAQSSYFVIQRFVNVTFDGNGGKFGEQATVLFKIVGGSAVTSVTEPTRNGYTFIGYNTSPDGSGNAVTVGEDGTVFADSTAVYAQWQSDNVDIIEVTVNAGGGVFANGDGIFAAIADADGKITVQAPTKYGYGFQGYNTKADGTGTAVTVGADGTAFTESTTIYAQWQLDRAALTAGYKMQFAVVGHNSNANADDMYLKADRLSAKNGFEISMVGFGSFEANEYVKLVFHTSDVNGGGWAIQESDLTVLVGKTQARYRKELIRFWDYVNFGNDKALNNAPEYVDHGDFFTLKIKVMDSEIPAFDGIGKVSLLALEFANGGIYAGDPVSYGMMIEGKPAGDPALQSSYMVIYNYEPDESLVDGYDMRFAADSDNVYARVERNATSLTLHLRGFKAFADGDFVRIVTHLGVAEDSNIWMIHKSDVSFVIYKDAAYVRSGDVSFFDGEAESFHGAETTVHAPVFTQHDEYWDLTLTIEYIEIGADVYRGTEIRAIMVKYTNGALQVASVKDGERLGDQALEKNWFVI